ncbi:hypothetical protein [Tepidibacter aestuarii]|uniref:hypothetical protein n=1 Tax=Tepidibacter aestuarii TaxID=2925782 RepID=UPI0020C06C17|nr:hypothetical protein [Tepidibacter aestuarii]CAH2213343.1 protein of unknown function [Tepidibacter aestuarii]
MVWWSWNSRYGISAWAVWSIAAHIGRMPLCFMGRIPEIKIESIFRPYWVVFIYTEGFR